MEREGIIFLTSQEPAHLQIPLFVLLCDDQVRKLVPFFLRDFDVGLDSRANEVVSLSVLKMKCEALAKKGKGKVFLHDLFPIDRVGFPRLDEKWFVFFFVPPTPGTSIQQYENRIDRKTWDQTLDHSSGNHPPL